MKENSKTIEVDFDSSSSSKTLIRYLRSRSFSMTRRSSLLYEAIVEISEQYEPQLLENLLMNFAQQVLPTETIDAIANEANVTVWPTLNFYSERQVSQFETGFSASEVESLIKLLENSLGPAVGEEDNLEAKIKNIASKSMESYYYNLNGFLPHDFRSLEYSTISHIESTGLDGKVYCEADENRGRQVSILLILSNNKSSFILVGDEDEPTFQLKKGTVLVFPSNYSCSYRLVGDGEPISILKMHCHHAA